MIEATITGLLKQICPQTYPTTAPAGRVAPFIVYTRVSTPRLRDFDGLTGMAMPTFRVDAYAANFDAARGMANAIRTKLDGYTDTEVQEIAVVNEQDLSDLTTEAYLSRVQLEFKVTHSE
ncbi:DUF3168 domain-containing protein [Microvirga sp. SRT01]|uniref:DUF3168 domain-containing protein n=1 Tax=Sphingomonas longa TaxID=2778730 RepID=A0ABS2D851_9SPHN|nr:MULTISPECIES: DUF3168 domain-containing protein [Alphaproteobacteria]MBM6577117.1 DUF3168 domain-containing protein [Sphingomonas sp. BT552]MBR7710161.1 DUF3168 domain-containing protein [Microvirga sp. SRT01]